MKKIPEHELKEMFDLMLDTCYEEIEILSMTYSPSTALEKVDPTAYRAEYLCYIDRMITDGEFYEDEKGDLYIPSANSNL